MANQNNQIPNSFQQTVFNAAHTVAKNLRYVDNNGDPVSRQFVNDYLDNTAQATSNLITQYNQIITVLQQYETAIVTLESEVTALQTSGTANLPVVSAGCFSSGNTVPITTAVNYLVSNSCSYNSVLDTTANLSLSILTQGNNLSSQPSYGNPGTTLANIAGWNLSPTTIANTINNLWLAVLDLRGGMGQLMKAITPTCNQVIVNCISSLPSFATGITIYFAGYTFIPSGFTDNGSTIQVSDTAGNTISQVFDIVNVSTSESVVVLISGTALLPNSNYTVTITSNVYNSTWEVTCQKTLIQTVVNNVTVCPLVNTFAATTSISYILTPYITSSVSYAISILSSGMTVLQTQTIQNPTQATSGSFGGLTSVTQYYIRVVTTLNGQSPVTCAAQSVTTTT